MIKYFKNLTTVCKLHWKEILGYSVLLHLLIHEIPLIIIAVWLGDTIG